MNSSAGCRLALCIAALTANFTPTIGHAQSEWSVPPDDTVAGLTQAEWSRAWWQWAGSFDRGDSPVGDQSGALCGRKQDGPVWFLAGTYGTHRTVRTCTVPSGKYLFFPLINYVAMPRPDGRSNCMTVMSTAAGLTNDASALIVDLDGHRLPDPMAHRQATRQCFDMGALAEPKVRVFPSAANGYYVMLKPLNPGTHTLNFGGVLPSMVQAVTYTLKVE